MELTSNANLHSVKVSTISEPKMMMRMLLGSARRRQLHTFIISKETIKPSSPTPSHLKTYNLSLLDQLMIPVYMPFLFFYPNANPTRKTVELLKNSLSQTLTQYYPFSGRLVDGTYVDCNDEGVDFFEVQTDESFAELVHLQDSEYQPLDHLAPTFLASAWHPPSEGWGSLVRVQLTYFSCGGIALAISMSHKIGDACSLFAFINHWASISSGKVNALPPHFVFSPKTNLSSLQNVVLDEGSKFVTKKFVFPNSKLALLKAKAKDGHGIMINPTRIEVLNSLLYGCAVSSSKSSSVKGYIWMQIVNMRNRMVPPLSETRVGNVCVGSLVSTMKDNRELDLNSLTARIKNAKMQLTGMTDDQMNQHIIQSVEFIKNQLISRHNDYESYTCSSLCRFPAYEVNFGWGKAIRVTLPGCPKKNSFILMDTPNGDGIGRRRHDRFSK